MLILFKLYIINELNCKVDPVKESIVLSSTICS